MFPDDFVEQENGFVGLAVEVGRDIRRRHPDAERCSSLDPVIAGGLAARPSGRENKFPSVLGSRPPVIKRVDRGD